MQNKSQNNKSSFVRGIKKAARWVAKMFGHKAESKFGRIVWYVFATGAAIIAAFIAIAIVYYVVDEAKYANETRKYKRQQNDPTYCHNYSNQYVSPYIIYHDGYPSYLYDTRIGRRTMTDICWVCKSSDGDSLTVFSDGERRGYFNRFTGLEAIPAQYEKAWVFSEGVACVMSKGTLHLIGHSGKTVMDKVFPYSPRIDDYCFHNGLCLMIGDNSLIGLIDKQGDWVVNPAYDEMRYDTKGFWIVQAENNYGLLDSQGKVLIPVEHEEIEISHTDNSIFVQCRDHIHQVLDFDCNVVNSCNFYEVEHLSYDTDEYDEYGDHKQATAHCLTYRTTDWYYGLMDAKGNIITPPYYSEINAIGPDRYHCMGTKGSVILDDKGKECGEKP